MDITETDDFIVRYEEKNREKVFSAAERLGCEVVVAGQNELQIDLDQPWPFGTRPYLRAKKSAIHTKAIDLFDEKIWWSLNGEINVTALRAWESRGGNTHVVLTLDREYSDFERIAFQTMLGSDPVCELLNWKRVVDGSDNPITLFKPRQPQHEKEE